jgi:hypothetical protein
MKKALAIVCAVWLVGLMAVGQLPPIPTCTLHVNRCYVGSCMECPTQEHPESCDTETIYYYYWCPANGACDVGHHCGESASQEWRIVCIEKGCINCCDEPGDPYCEYDMGDVDVYEDWVPEDCVCWENK